MPHSRPGASYTAIPAGKNGGTGVGLVEVYDTNRAADSQLANISTRGFVQTGNNIMIGGFILGGGSNNTGVRLVRFLISSFPVPPLLETVQLSDGLEEPCFQPGFVSVELHPRRSLAPGECKSGDCA